MGKAKVTLEPFSPSHLRRHRCFLLRSLQIFLHFSAYTDQTIVCILIFPENEYIIPNLPFVFPATYPFHSHSIYIYGVPTEVPGLQQSPKRQLLPSLLLGKLAFSRGGRQKAASVSKPRGMSGADKSQGVK